ncbi:MAG: hypothetical protein AAF989_07005 [Planctomycetota bacterium]
MKQLQGLWRDTWWLWLLFLVLILGLSLMAGWFFLSLIPTLPCIFAYFAFIRYDEDGNENFKS